MPEAIEQANLSHLRVEQAQQEAHQAKQQHDQYLRSLEATQQVVIDLQRLITGHIVATATAALTGRPGEEALCRRSQRPLVRQKRAGRLHPGESQERRSPLSLRRLMPARLEIAG